MAPGSRVRGRAKASSRPRRDAPDTWPPQSPSSVQNLRRSETVVLSWLGCFHSYCACTARLRPPECKFSTTPRRPLGLTPPRNDLKLPPTLKRNLIGAKTARRTKLQKLGSRISGQSARRQTEGLTNISAMAAANLNALADVAANLFISLPESPQGKPFNAACP